LLKLELPQISLQITHELSSLLISFS